MTCPHCGATWEVTSAALLAGVNCPGCKKHYRLVEQVPRPSDQNAVFKQQHRKDRWRP